MTSDEKKELNSIIDRLTDIHSELADKRADIDRIEDKIEAELGKLENIISDSE